MVYFVFSYVWIVCLALLIAPTRAFAPPAYCSCRNRAEAPTTTRLFGDRGAAQEDHFLMQEFSIHTGEVLNPYKVLDVPRSASSSEVRDSYVKLSRRYHPDIVRHKDILPGSCNNLDEVRDQWERIKLSYEILRNNRTRKRYDRHEVLADPKAAVGRAAMDAVGKGLAGVGKGLFSIGAHAVKQMTKQDKEEPSGKAVREK